MSRTTSSVKIIVPRLLLLIMIIWSLIGVSQATAQRTIVGCALNAQSASIEDLGEVLPSGTGNPTLDQGIQNDVLEIEKLFGVRAKMFLMRERGGPNAFALSVQHTAEAQILRSFNIPPQYSPDGVVVFGLNLMAAEFNSNFRTGYAIPSIIGHEYAHIMQFKNNFPLHGKWIELHADYMAGWFTAHRGRFLQQNAYESAGSFFNKGDYAFNNPSHHGTPAQRLEAFKAGFSFNISSNSNNANVAYQNGITFLRSAGAQ